MRIAYCPDLSPRSASNLLLGKPFVEVAPFYSAIDTQIHFDDHKLERGAANMLSAKGTT